jgi:ABC-type phosphate/phosphonate transport system permease subunit
VYSLYEGKNDYGVRIGINIVIWARWINKRLTCRLCGCEWVGTMKKFERKRFGKLNIFKVGHRNIFGKLIS